MADIDWLPPPPLPCGRKGCWRRRVHPGNHCGALHLVSSLRRAARGNTSPSLRQRKERSFHLAVFQITILTWHPLERGRPRFAHQFARIERLFAFHDV